MGPLRRPTHLHVGLVAGVLELAAELHHGVGLEEVLLAQGVVLGQLSRGHAEARGHLGLDLSQHRTDHNSDEHARRSFHEGILCERSTWVFWMGSVG